MRPDLRERRTEDDVRQRRQMVGEALHRKRAGQILR
jgi:hypothetical protein